MLLFAGEGLNGTGLLRGWELGSPGDSISDGPSIALGEIPAVPNAVTHTAPGEAHQHVACSQLRVVPLHPAVLVQQQGKRAVPIRCEDCLVGVCLEKAKAPP